MPEQRVNKFAQKYIKDKEKTSTDDFVEAMEKLNEKQNNDSSEEILPKPIEKNEIIPEENNEAQKEKDPEPQKPARKKGQQGRPRESFENKSSVSFQIPESTKEKLDFLSRIKAKSNTSYIVYLIEKEYEQNKTFYDELRKTLN